MCDWFDIHYVCVLLCIILVFLNYCILSFFYNNSGVFCQRCLCLAGVLCHDVWQADCHSVTANDAQTSTELHALPLCKCLAYPEEGLLKVKYCRQSHWQTTTFSILRHFIDLHSLRLPTNVKNKSSCLSFYMFFLS